MSKKTKTREEEKKIDIGAVSEFFKALRNLGIPDFYLTTMLKLVSHSPKEADNLITGFFQKRSSEIMKLLDGRCFGPDAYKREEFRGLVVGKRDCGKRHIIPYLYETIDELQCMYDMLYTPDESWNDSSLLQLSSLFPVFQKYRTDIFVENTGDYKHGYTLANIGSLAVVPGWSYIKVIPSQYNREQVGNLLDNNGQKRICPACNFLLFVLIKNMIQNSGFLRAGFLRAENDRILVDASQNAKFQDSDFMFVRFDCADRSMTKIIFSFERELPESFRVATYRLPDFVV